MDIDMDDEFPFPLPLLFTVEIELEGPIPLGTDNITQLLPPFDKPLLLLPL